MALKGSAKQKTATEMYEALSRKVIFLLVCGKQSTNLSNIFYKKYKIKKKPQANDPMFTSYVLECGVYA